MIIARVNDVLSISVPYYCVRPALLLSDHNPTTATAVAMLCCVLLYEGCSPVVRPDHSHSCLSCCVVFSCVRAVLLLSYHTTATALAMLCCVLLLPCCVVFYCCYAVLCFTVVMLCCVLLLSCCVVFYCCYALLCCVVFYCCHAVLCFTVVMLCCVLLLPCCVVYYCVRAALLLSDHTTATVEGAGTTADVDGTNPIAVTCRGEGDPQPQVTWSKVGEDINATHAQIFGALMQLGDTPSAIGLYACNATNDRGSDFAYFACECR